MPPTITFSVPWHLQSLRVPWHLVDLDAVHLYLSLKTSPGLHPLLTSVITISLSKGFNPVGTVCAGVMNETDQPRMMGSIPKAVLPNLSFPSV